MDSSCILKFIHKLPNSIFPHSLLRVHSDFLQHLAVLFWMAVVISALSFLINAHSSALFFPSQFICLGSFRLFRIHANTLFSLFRFIPTCQQYAWCNVMRKKVLLAFFSISYSLWKWVVLLYFQCSLILAWSILRLFPVLTKMLSGMCQILAWWRSEKENQHRTWF